MNRKWRVTTTKSKKRWVAWRVRSKKKSGVVFDTWKEAVTYALLSAKTDYIMSLVKIR